MYFDCIERPAENSIFQIPSRDVCKFPIDACSKNLSHAPPMVLRHFGLWSLEFFIACTHPRFLIGARAMGLYEHVGVKLRKTLVVLHFEPKSQQGGLHFPIASRFPAANNDTGRK